MILTNNKNNNAFFAEQTLNTKNYILFFFDRIRPCYNQP